MVTSDFRPKVEILPFRACAMKNTQYNAHFQISAPPDIIGVPSKSRQHDGTVDMVYSILCHIEGSCLNYSSME